MRIFEKGNWMSNKCPICKTQDDGQVVLVAKYGTERDNIQEAEQVHVACLDLTIDDVSRLIYQIVP